MEATILQPTVEPTLEEAIKKFDDYYLQNYHFFSSAAEVFKTLIGSLLKANNIAIDSLTFRVKDKDECISKFKRKYYDEIEEDEKYCIQDYITDIVGLRIVSLYADEIENIQKCMESNFKEIEITDKIKAIESTENQFGYKGLHLDLMLNDERTNLQEYRLYKDVRFELQIRSIIQDAWSVLDHKIKYKKNIPNQLKRRVNCLSALFEMADEEFLRIRKETQNEQEKAKETIDKLLEQTSQSVSEPANNSPAKTAQDKIDVFKFLSIVKEYFPDYPFIDYKVDGFVSELLKVDSNLSSQTLIEALKAHQEEMNDYSRNGYVADRMNPYTTVRHCLFLSDREKYKNILYHTQKQSLDNWQKQKVN